MANEEKGHQPKGYKLQVNRKICDWPEPQISGAQIKVLAESPSDYVVNHIINGPGEDPEVADGQLVELSPNGVEKFVTRKPKTTPGQ